MKSCNANYIEVTVQHPHEPKHMCMRVTSARHMKSGRPLSPVTLRMANFIPRET